MTQRYQSLMIGHGALVLFLGLVTGYLFAFNLVGEITLWPIPGTIDLQLPGDAARWRGAHVGMITNALMIIAIALALPHLRLTPGVERLTAWGMILTVWGNVGFYLASALGASGRGLTFGPNKFGGGDAASIFNFLIALPGAFLSPVILILVARGAFTAARESRAPR